MIPDKQLKEFREAVLNSARPLIFFDDDPDGLCSFLQLYKLNPEAKGVIYKHAGPLDFKFLKKVHDMEPDAVFILDIAEVSQDFLDKVPNVYWLDHHSPQKKRNVKYFNPMIEDNNDNRPVSYWTSKIAEDVNWLSIVGCVSDWFLPEDLVKEFENKDLLPETIKTPEEALFKTDAGKLARALSFILKGRNSDAMKSVKVLTRIKNPYELLEQSTAQGKYIWKKFQKMNKIYEELKNSVEVTKDKIILFRYSDVGTSLTSDLSNEILFEHPEKFIIIDRFKNGEHKCSLRSSKYEVLTILKKALKDVNGFGGGHMHACGCHVVDSDFEQFVENIRKQL